MRDERQTSTCVVGLFLRTTGGLGQSNIMTYNHVRMGASTGKPCYPAPTPHIVTHHLPPGLSRGQSTSRRRWCRGLSQQDSFVASPWSTRCIVHPSGRLVGVLLPDFPLQRARIKLRPPAQSRPETSPSPTTCPTRHSVWQGLRTIPRHTRARGPTRSPD